MVLSFLLMYSSVVVRMFCEILRILYQPFFFTVRYCVLSKILNQQIKLTITNLQKKTKMKSKRNQWILFALLFENMNTEQRYAVDDDQAMKKNFVFIYAHIPLPLLRMEEKKCVFLALLVLEFANDDDDNDDVVSQQHCMQNSGNLHIRCVMVLIFHPVHTI